MINAHPVRTAILLLAGILILTFAPVVFLNRSLIPPLFYPLGPTESGTYGYEGRRPFNGFNIDMATGIYADWPLNVLSGTMWLRGKVPLWDQYQGAGVPILAQTGFKTLFPYQIAENISPWWLWDLFILGRMFLAGIFAFLFLRRIGTAWFAAFFGGMAYMLSGLFTWFWHLEQFTNVALIVPMLFWAARVFLDRLTLSATALLGAAIGISLFSGTPSSVIYVMLFLFIYLAACLWRERTRLRGNLTQSVLLAVTAAAIGIAVAAPLLLPFLEYFSVAFNYRDAPGNQLGAQSVNPFHLIFELFAPSLTEAPAFFRDSPWNGIWDEIGGYGGIAATIGLLWGIAIACRKRGFRDFHFITFTLLWLAMTLKNAGIPPFVWLGRLPLLSMVWTPRWGGPVLIFALIVAATRLLHHFSNTAHERNGNGQPGTASQDLGSTSPLRRLFIFLGAGGAAYALLAAAFFFLVPEKTETFTRLDTTTALVKLLPIVFLSLILIPLMRRLNEPRMQFLFVAVAFLDLWFTVPRGYEPTVAILLLIPVCFGLIALFFSLLRTNTMALAASVIFLGAFLAIDYAAKEGPPSRENPYREPPFVRFLKERGADRIYRVLGTDGVLMPNVASAFGLLDTHYINGISPLLFHEFREQNLHYYCQVGTSSESMWMTGVPFTYLSGDKTILCTTLRDFKKKMPYYDLIGVRYIVTPQNRDINAEANIPPSDPDYLPRIYAEEVNIFENRRALPRLFLAQKTMRASSLEEAQKFTRRLGADIRETAVVEDFLDLPLSDAPPSAATESIDITHSFPGETRARLVLSRPSLAVLTDTFSAGWEAYLDGKKTALLRVNGTFQGVVVPAGEHALAFRYRPESFTKGLWSFWYIIVVSAAIVVYERRKGRLSQPPRNNALLMIPFIILIPFFSYARVVEGALQKGIDAARTQNIYAMRLRILDAIKDNEAYIDPFRAVRIENVEFLARSAEYAYITYGEGGHSKKAFIKIVTNGVEGKEQSYHRRVQNYFDKEGGRWTLSLPPNSEVIGAVVDRDAIEFLGLRPLWHLFAFDNERDPLQLTVLLALADFETGKSAENETTGDNPAFSRADKDVFRYNETLKRWEQYDDALCASSSCQ